MVLFPSISLAKIWKSKLNIKPSRIDQNALQSRRYKKNIRLMNKQWFYGAILNLYRPDQLMNLINMINLTNLINLVAAKFAFVFQIWSVDTLMIKISIKLDFEASNNKTRQMKQKKPLCWQKNRSWYLHWKTVLICQCFERSYDWIQFIYVYFSYYYYALRHSEYVVVPATIWQALFCLMKW